MLLGTCHNISKIMWCRIFNHSLSWMRRYLNHKPLLRIRHHRRPNQKRRKEAAGEDPDLTQRVVLPLKIIQMPELQHQGEAILAVAYQKPKLLLQPRNHSLKCKLRMVKVLIVTVTVMEKVMVMVMIVMLVMV